MVNLLHKITFLPFYQNPLGNDWLHTSTLSNRVRKVTREKKQVTQTSDSISFVGLKQKNDNTFHQSFFNWVVLQIFIWLNVTWIVPWQWIVVISGPLISIPSSFSNDIPAEVMLKGNATGGDVEDFANFMNLSPARDKIRAREYSFEYSNMIY